MLGGIFIFGDTVCQIDGTKCCVINLLILLKQ